MSVVVRPVCAMFKKPTVNYVRENALCISDWNRVGIILGITSFGELIDIDGEGKISNSQVQELLECSRHFSSDKLIIPK